MSTQPNPEENNVDQISPFAGEWSQEMRAAFADVLAAIRLHGEALAQNPAVLGIRPGFRSQNARLKPRPALVVSVLRKQDVAQVPPHLLIPRKLGKVVVDVVQATPHEQLEFLRKQQANFADAPAAWIKLTISDEPPAAEAADDANALQGYVRPEELFEEFSKTVEQEMTVVCHASPDAGWRNLKDFIEHTNERLTATMYEFNAGYILNALINSLGESKRMSLILDGGAADEIPSASQGDVSKAHARQALADALTDDSGSRFTSVWAPVADDGKTTAAFFPTAYHIKVTVRDGEYMWLSSGNWKRSNQPERDPINNPFTTPAQAWSFLRNKQNREWHVIIRNKKLAGLFEEYINYDIEQATPLQKEEPADSTPAAEQLPDLFIAAPEDDESDLTAPTFFKEKPFTKNLRVRPLLTPDNYLEAVLPLFENAQRKIYFQNQSLGKPYQAVPEYARLYKILRDKSRDNNIDVRIIVSQYAKLQDLTAANFNMSRVKVQQNCHNKGIIIDDEFLVLGSHNWTGQGATFNRDASLIFDDPEIIKYFNDIFVFDWNNVAAFEDADMVAGAIVAQPDEEPPPGMIRVPWTEFYPDWRDGFDQL